VGIAERLQEALARLGVEKKPLDLSRFQDPLAEKTQWTPARSGGTNFRTHALRELSPVRVAFRMSGGGLLFNLIFLLAGLGIIMGSALSHSPGRPFLMLLFPVLFGMIFAGVGGGMLFFSARPIVFDKSLGWFWKGYRQPSLMGGSPPPRIGTPLSRIHALQILSESVRGDKGSFTSYELNLVLRDGTRLNVLDHGNYNRLVEDARRLASFLGVRIWDATSRDR